MTSTQWYTLLVLAIGVERVVELLVAHHNGRISRSDGGIEYGARHYPLIVALHALLLVSCVVEVNAANRPFLPWLGWPMLAAVAFAQCLRWWCILTLGPRWNTRVLVVPGLPLVRRGPYRFLRHPNYLAVAVEVLALPLVHTALVTATVFTAANAVLLRLRIRVEDTALAAAGS